MIGSVFVFAAVAVAPLAVTALPAPAHPAPYDETPKPYGFEYGVHDRYTHPPSPPHALTALVDFKLKGQFLNERFCLLVA